MWGEVHCITCLSFSRSFSLSDEFIVSRGACSVLRLSPSRQSRVPSHPSQALLVPTYSIIVGCPHCFARGSLTNLYGNPHQNCDRAFSPADQPGHDRPPSVGRTLLRHKAGACGKYERGDDREGYCSRSRTLGSRGTRASRSRRRSVFEVSF